MEWTIVVTPTDEALTGWMWTAERADGETTRFGRDVLRTDGIALEEARREVRAVERSLLRIKDATISEVYLPTDEELLVAE